MFKLTCCVAELQSVGIFCLDYCVQGLCGSNIVVKSTWNSSQSIMDKRGLSSATAADDIDDGYVEYTKVIADEEHDDQNRKGCYHEGDKDCLHIRNQLHSDAGLIDDIQDKMRRMQILKTNNDAILQVRGRINEDQAEGQSKS